MNPWHSATISRDVEGIHSPITLLYPSPKYIETSYEQISYAIVAHWGMHVLYITLHRVAQQNYNTAQHANFG